MGTLMYSAPHMRAITFIRGVCIVGVVAVGWSMTLRWGDIGSGPPAQWERQVVGAVVLSMLCTGALMAMGVPGTRRSWIARGIAAVAAAIGVTLALLLWKNAGDSGFTQLLSGAGWRWMLGGTGLCLAGAVSALSIKGEARLAPKAAKKAPARKRASKKKR